MRLSTGPLLACLAGSALAAAPLERPKPAPRWPPAPAAERLRFEYEIRGPEEPAERVEKGAAYWLKLALGIENGRETEVKAESLLRPTGLWAGAGTLLIADPGRGGVLRYDVARRKGEWLGRGAGAMPSPVAVAEGADGRVYILDSVLRKVLILDAEGAPAGELHGDPQGLGQPAGLAVSKDRVYVSDVANHRVAVYGLEGLYLQSFGQRGARPGEFNFPTYLAFDLGSRELWVSDSGNFRLQWFDAAGAPKGRLGQPGDRPGYLARPRGVARDSDGHVFLSDAAFDALQVFDTQGRLLLFAGLSGTAPGEFDLPAGVVIDEKDRVFVADTQNGRVQVLQYLKEPKP